ncbi:MAG: type II toxin-antitoxin system HicA family toxin [Calditrichaeota bacterium]|nr:type II toxin-antitoxin system HicA family toxin [Calditrichota bacterium]
MTKLPLIDAHQMEKLLVSLGFERARQRGSHVVFRHTDGRRTTVPQHGSRVLSRPLLRAILHEIDMSIETYLQLLNDL